ncbi:MAG: hypothetical protein FJ395_07730 [Verrucomicrobia bacterium]|nr:hypothetical protein [Verrucomicrobiota bacterium]
MKLCAPFVVLLALTALAATSGPPRAAIDAAKWPSLQAALDALPAAGGKVVLPPGDFELIEPLRLSRENTFVEGAGPATHLINKNTNGLPAFVIAPADAATNKKARLWRVQLGNFRVTGNPQSGDGIRAELVQEIFIHGLSVERHGGHGINLVNCYENPRIAHCNITYNGQAGLNLTNCHDIVVNANQFEENLDAVRCADSFNLTMNGNNVDDHLRHGVIIENTYGSVLSGNMIEECNGIAIILDRDCYGITLSANVIAHHLGGGIDLRDAWGCAISANTFTLVHSNSITVGPASGRLTITGNHFCNSYIGGKDRRPAESKHPMGRDAGSGILLDGTSDIIITGNSFSGLEGEPVRRTNKCQRIVVNNNAVVDVNRNAAREKPSAAVKPNIIIILTDDQGYGDLGCHGNPVLKTPQLDKLHAESIRFTDFHVAPMCTPTRGQLLTGRDALVNGASSVCSGRTFVRRDVPTMAELFAGAGYQTGLFGKWHLGDNYPHRPNDRGFHESVYHLSWGITSTPDHWNNDYFDDFFRHNGEVKQFKGYCTDVFFNEAQRWMKSCASAGKPFFCYLTPNAPHGPFWVADRYKKPYKHLPPDVAGFFGMMANLDENVGRLEAMLRQSGLRENTILIFMGDNGGTGGISVFNAGLRGAKASLYDGGHRAPWFLRWPAGKLRPAGDVPELTQAQDVLPTLLELCGVKPRHRVRFDGVSLAPLLRGQPQPVLAERKLVVQYGGLTESDPVKWDAAVLHRNWRLVHGRELYDILADPSQQTDVAAQHPDLARALRAHYEKWWAAAAPGLRQYETMDIGSQQENLAVLTSIDWLAPKLTPASQPFDIRLLGQTLVKEGSLPGGRPQPVMNGFWNVRVVRDGMYRISLRRWPREADAPLAGSVSAYKGVDGSFPEGKALPIASARLCVGRFDGRVPVRSADTEAVFETRLRAGKTRLQTWFYDAQGRELCGAFYVTVERR